MSSFPYTTLGDIDTIHSTLKASFLSGKMRNVSYRKEQLAKLAYLVKDNTKAICDALYADVNRNPTEVILSETSIILAEVANVYSNVSSWAKDINPPTGLNFRLMKLRIKPTPKGVVLIIAPFNFPLLLTFMPLIGALAAGCTVVLKISEALPNTSPLIQNLVEKYLDPHVVRVVQGGIMETSKLLQLRWDHILFTGSARVGHIVSAAAAKHNTPITLELGGKCPVIIDHNYPDFPLIARRLSWGRNLNSGQACTAPDFVLISRSRQDQLIKELKKAYEKFFPVENNLPRLISTDATKRIKGYLDGTEGEIVIGGKTDVEHRFISPTVVMDVNGTDTTMQEEIFGPVLSIIPVDSLDEAIDIINSRPQPLAIYVFSENEQFKEKVTRSTRSGSIVYNDVVLQAGVLGLPLGGAGESGHGQYKGKYGFDTFTHFRSSMETPRWMDRIVAVRYPPFTSSKHSAAVRLTAVSLPFDRQGRLLYSRRVQPWLGFFTFIVIGSMLVSIYLNSHPNAWLQAKERFLQWREM